MPKPTNNKGLSIVEVLSSFAIISIGLIAMLSSSVALVGATRFSKNFLIGSQLAREGLEVVKKIRDRNVLGSNSFETGIKIIGNPNPEYKILQFDNGGGVNPFTGEFQLVDIGAGNNLNTCINVTGDCQLNFYDINSVNLYGNGEIGDGTNSTNGNPSVFYRVITVNNILCQDAVPDAQTDPPNGSGICQDTDVVGLEVTSQVEWITPGNPIGITMVTKLFNWQ